MVCIIKIVILFFLFNEQMFILNILYLKAYTHIIFPNRIEVNEMSYSVKNIP